MSSDIITIEMDLTEKKEMIIESYRSTYDIESAYIKCSVTLEERKVLEQDEGFQERIKFHLLQIREDIVASFEDLMYNARKDDTRLKATIELGKLTWPEKFLPEKDGYGDRTPVTFNQNNLNLNLENNSKTHAAEVLEILSENGAFESQAGELTRTKAN